MRKASYLLAAVLLAASCSSSSGLGDIFGTNPNNTNYPTNYPTSTQSSDVSGTVNYVDTQSHVITLNNAYYNSNLRNSQGTSNNGTIYYDSRTQVLFNGRQFNVTDLERGDEVSIRGYNNGGQWVADTITVTRNVRQ